MENIELPAKQNSIFETHCHYDDEKFSQCRDEILNSLPDMGVYKAVTCSVDVDSSIHNMKISEQYDYVYFAAGFHPENLPDTSPYLDDIKPLLEHKKCVALGEIGLDYYFDSENREHQKDWFQAQLILANELSLPAIVHDREAHEDTLALLKRHKPSGVVHCFSGSVESAKEIISLGMYLGFGGVCTFKNAKKCREVIKEVPLSCILLETDAPYLAPEPYRGKLCHSGMIIRTAEQIAEIKGVSLDVVLDTTKQNAKELFKI